MLNGINWWKQLKWVDCGWVRGGCKPQATSPQGRRASCWNQLMEWRQKSEMEWMKRSKPNNKPKEMKIEFLWFLLALPAALNERNGAHAKRPKARGKPKKQTKQFHSTRLSPRKPALNWVAFAAAERANKPTTIKRSGSAEFDLLWVMSAERHLRRRQATQTHLLNSFVCLSSLV